jgi:hypothetical protein
VGASAVLGMTVPKGALALAVFPFNLKVWKSESSSANPSHPFELHQIHQIRQIHQIH